MTVRGPFRDGYVWVHDRKCDTCIYRPGNLMNLADGVRDVLTQQAVDDNAVFICHETHDDDLVSTCRGFYDVHRGNVAVLQIAERLGRLKFDEPPGRLT